MPRPSPHDCTAEPSPSASSSWSDDGDGLVVIEPLLPGARVFRRDLKTGGRVLVRDLGPGDPTGIARSVPPRPRGEAFAAVYTRASTALFLVQHLRRTALLECPGDP